MKTTTESATGIRQLLRILRDLAKAYATLRSSSEDETDRNLAFATIRRRAYELLTWLAEEESKPTKQKEI